MQFVRLFESMLAEYAGFKEAVCVDCCTNGILISLETLRRMGKVSEDNELSIPYRTYMSVPMTLVNNGWKIRLVDADWKRCYAIPPSPVYDAATDFDRNMALRYPDDAFVCVSFQQKKRLSLGRGGAILLNNSYVAGILRRMAYDGRDPFISDMDEVENKSDDVLLGYHCYMDPEKAALGIARLNQLSAPYSPADSSRYPDLRNLKIWPVRA